MARSIRLSQPENVGRAASVARVFFRGEIDAPVSTGAALFVGDKKKGGVRSSSRRPSTMYASQNIAPHHRAVAWVAVATAQRKISCFPY